MILFPAAILAIENEEDRKFMEEVYLQYKALMFRYAYKVTNQKYNAEDIVSATCVALIRNLQKLQKISGKKRLNYVARAARSASYDYVRRSNSGSNKGFLFGDDGDFDIAAEVAALDEALIREAEIDMLREGLRQIAPKHREVLEMKYFEMLPDEEIAKHLGIGAASVRYYLTRARRALMEAMSEIDE